MSLDTATSDQLDQVNNFSRLVRSIMVECAMAMNHMNAAMAAWNASVGAIVGTPSGIVINDGTGLAGAAIMTDTELIGLVGYIINCQTIANGPGVEAALVQAIGPNNMIG